MQTQKKLKILFLVFGIFASIVLLVNMPYLMPVVIGGVITQGVLGGFSGKVGPVVGGKWKSIDYMRGYVIPSNPNTAGQQTVRNKFKKLVAIAKNLLPNLIHVYWDPFYSDMSGYNAFISKNYATLDVSNDLQATSVISLGSLEDLKSNTSTYTTVSGLVTCTFSAVINGNGLATDEVGMAIYDKSTDQCWFTAPHVARSAGSVTLNIGTGKTATNLIAFCFAYRGTGSAFIVSNSIGDVLAPI